MSNLIAARSTHSGRLERWLGTEQVERISLGMRDWYGPDIAVAATPGRVYARKGGDFVGTIRGGVLATHMDQVRERTRKRMQRWARVQMRTYNTGFSSLSDLISEATAGKKRTFAFQKTGVTGVVGACMSLWKVGPTPPAGADGSAAPGGRAPDDTTTGGYPFTDPTGGDTQHITTCHPFASVVNNTLMLYDRIFDVAKTMNSVATESVTGVPTRYQSSTPSDTDYAAGNFVFPECTTILPATAHNWTVCLYRNQAGTDAQTMPSLTGNATNIAQRLDMPVMQWFSPLATGDTGVMDLNQMQCSALVATGAINFVIGHPLAWLPCPVANSDCVQDGINSAFNLTQVMDAACLALLELMKPATGATSYNLTVETVSG